MIRDLLIVDRGYTPVAVPEQVRPDAYVVHPGAQIGGGYRFDRVLCLADLGNPETGRWYWEVVYPRLLCSNRR